MDLRSTPDEHRCRAEELHTAARLMTGEAGSASASSSAAPVVSASVLRLQEPRDGDNPKYWPWRRNRQKKKDEYVSSGEEAARAAGNREEVPQEVIAESLAAGAAPEASHSAAAPSGSAGPKGKSKGQGPQKRKRGRGRGRGKGDGRGTVDQPPSEPAGEEGDE